MTPAHVVVARGRGRVARTWHGGRVYEGHGRTREEADAALAEALSMAPPKGPAGVRP